jgi:hypothetical protein
MLATAMPALALAQGDVLPDAMAAPEAAPRDVREAVPAAPAESGVPLPGSRPEDMAAPASEAAASTTLPGEEAECRAELRELGAEFLDADPVAEPASCAISHPVELSSLGAGVALEPAALLTCRMALASARFVRDVVEPEARRRFDASVATVRQVSAHVCRTRHGAGAMSEHATGNALDWGAIVLDDDTEIEIRAHGVDEAVPRAFLRHIRGRACGPFTTVLGPGTDGAHADHFHFDLAERRNGSAYCR